MYALAGQWNLWGFVRDFDIDRWNISVHTLDGIVYFFEEGNPKPDEVPDWALEDAALFGTSWEAVDAPRLGKLPVGGVPVVSVGDTLLLTSEELDEIIRPTIEMINKWSKWNPFHVIPGLFDLDSPFAGMPEGTKIRYFGIDWEPCEINYIVQGHAHRHLGFSPSQSEEAVQIWNGFLPIMDLIPGIPGHQTPTWRQLRRKLFWTKVGYFQYSYRKDW